MVDVNKLAAVIGKGIVHAVAPLVLRIKALEERAPVPGPAGEKGEPGEPGAVGARGPEGPEGKPGRDGRDGLPGVQGEKGIDGAHGKDGCDGVNGADGLGFDDLTVEHDGERAVTFKFVRGEQVKAFTVTLPTVLDRGVFKAGGQYQKGDGVTFGGHYWIAQAETADAPGDGVKSWRLAVSRGREGKAGRDGRDLRDAPVVSIGGRK